ncbi:cilia- and flagella-associated protein 46-like isoform X2 [Anneissia japonica]|uniref:cilia- and flagella-associated protein 46-like isoform X2 n=1 Tax=Anneissia japonica TaxID=1529436 RepID=UPI00142550E7|nr:cilia- and flagella-associated protein 46-like isoform X2 [Anneissia japonica]
MDSNIRQLLSASQIYGVEGEDSFLHQAFEQLKAASDRRPSSDGPEPCGQDLYVQCAEIALQYGLTDMTKACLSMYLHRTPPSNQFLCRAYLCHAQLLAPKSAEEISQLDKAVVYILKAIQFAKENARYNFLVFNASVLYWQFCRPFLKPNYRQHLSISLHSVVKALDDIDDKDYEWRAQLMLALIECHVDAGRSKEAAEVSKAAAEFTKANVPKLYKQVLQLQVQHNLVESNKLAKEIKSNGDLTGYYKLARMRLSLEQNDVPDIKSSLERLLNQFLQEDDDITANSRASSVMSTFGRKTPQAAIPQTPTIEESKSKPPTTIGNQGSKGSFASLVTSLVRGSTTSSDVPLLLIELCRLCLEQDQADLASQAIQAIKTCPIKETGLLLELEFLEAELIVRNLGDKQEIYSKSSVEVRLQCIHRLNEALQTAIRLGDPNVLQVGCSTMWNVCLPLLQPNLRHHVRKPLTVIAEALENIDSLLILLRCQIHTELARCEEDVEQVEIAMSHLKKALALDDGGHYNERLQHALQRLSLRAELYQQPERMEDQAAMIIEQARTSAESGSIRMKRSLLVRAGQALSPDAFLHVLDSESDTKAAAGTGRGYQGILSEFGSKAKNFNKCVRKLEGHLKRLGNENDRERARLWADIAKTARKQEVWDVCRIAARYCLLYDDDRWHMARPQTVSHLETHSESVGRESVNETPTGQRKRTGTAEQPSTGLNTPHSDKDLIRMLAEIYFLNAEALIHLLRSEGVKLNTKPIPPEDKRKHPKGYVSKKPEEDEDWITYSEWIASLSQSATQCFLRAAELGCALGESWIVCNAAAYLWNYNNHLLMDGRHRELIEPFNKLLKAMKQVGHARETCLLVNLCNALAIGLMKQWIPVQPKDRPIETPQKAGKEKDEKTPKAKSVASHASAKSKILLVDAEAQDDLKKALEVCDYALEVTNGNKPLDVVPISVRHHLINTWVQTKQLLLQQINKGLGTEDEGNSNGQRPMTRCLVALEMHSLSSNGILEFKEQPSLTELANLVEQCKWSEPLVELQVWVRLSEMAYKTCNHQLVLKSTSMALRFDDNMYASKVKKLDKHKYTVWQEMLSFASCVLGKSLINNMHGKNVIRRSALEAFLNATRYGRRADNYMQVISSARYYWNTCLPLVCEVIERQLLMEPLNIILDCITATYCNQAGKGIVGRRIQPHFL